MVSYPPKSQVHHLFNAIAPTYDLVNKILSLGLDKRWRKEVLKHIPEQPPLSLLDLATGTGDQALLILKHRKNVSALGIDTAVSMLAKAEDKAKAALVQDRVKFQEASALALPFPDHSFDVLTISFGIRNVDSLETCFKEMYRVLKPGGQLLILEFSLPKLSWMKALYLLYLRHLLPRIGNTLSKHPSAYSYLNATIESFPYGNALCSLLQDAGFRSSYTPYTFGVVSLYRNTKPL